MKISALCGITRHAGGLFYAVRSLCQELHRKDVQISVFGRSGIDMEKDLPTWSPVPASAYKSFGPLAFSTELRSILKEEMPDLIHQHGLWLDDQWASLQWQKRTGKSVVISPHGMLDPWALKNSGWKKKIVGKLFVNQSLHSATCIHALCSSEAESIRAYGLKNPIAVIPNGIELPSDEIKFRLKKDSEVKRLLFLGRIHPKKGIKELVQAWANQKKKHNINSNWELLIAGWDDGGYISELINFVDRLGVSDSIKFVGPIFGRGKDELFRDVDAFILPSFSEGLPMSILEAWSYKLPVIMTGFCNLPDGFTYDAAIKIDPEIDSITVGLDKLMSLSSAQLNEIGNNGRSLVEKNFTLDIVSNKMFELYDWCLNGGDLPSFIRLN